MIFTDISYSIFLLIVVVLVLATKRFPVRNTILLVSSYIFYGWWDWRFLSLLVISSSVDYLAALLMDGRLKTPWPWLTRKRTLFVSIFVNLSILGTFKYFDFFIASAQDVIRAVSVDPSVLYLSITLPVGISFYTFQSMSYSIDVYRGQQRAEPNPIDFFLYVSFFPQLVAGPIERAGSLLTQFKKTRPINFYEIRNGLELIAFGLFKKLLIADNLAAIVDRIFAAPDAGVFALTLGVYAFAFQIYCDFSGYTDIARGSARLLGINLRLNFHMPYFANDPRDFWRRWHISLSEWFRDYVYIPLGGHDSRLGRTAANVILTMALCGLWHGAEWTFVLWGLYHGILIAITPRPVRKPEQPTPAHRPIRKFKIDWRMKRAISTLVTFNLVCFGWLIFRAENYTHLELLIHNAIALPAFSAFDTGSLIAFACLIAPLVALEIGASLTGQRDMRHVMPPLRYGLVIAMMYLALIGQPADVAPFIYFQF